MRGLAEPVTHAAAQQYVSLSTAAPQVQNANQLFDALDKDHDGVLTREEFYGTCAAAAAPKKGRKTRGVKVDDADSRSSSVATDSDNDTLMNPQRKTMLGGLMALIAIAATFALVGGIGVTKGFRGLAGSSKETAAKETPGVYRIDAVALAKDAPSLSASVQGQLNPGMLVSVSQVEIVGDGEDERVRGKVAGKDDWFSISTPDNGGFRWADKVVGEEGFNDAPGNVVQTNPVTVAAAGDTASGGGGGGGGGGGSGGGGNAGVAAGGSSGLQVGDAAPTNLGVGLQVGDAAPMGLGVSPALPGLTNMVPTIVAPAGAALPPVLATTIAPATTAAPQTGDGDADPLLPPGGVVRESKDLNPHYKVKQSCFHAGHACFIDADCCRSRCISTFVCGAGLPGPVEIVDPSTRQLRGPMAAPTQPPVQVAN